MMMLWDVLMSYNFSPSLFFFPFFLPMSGYVLNVVISNEKKKNLKNAYFPKK